MSICGSSNDEHDIITLHYTEEGLLTVGENRESPAATFGDDIAMKCLATEFQRAIYVVKRKSYSLSLGLYLFCFALFVFCLGECPSVWKSYLFGLLGVYINNS
ncbi:unnamed protein product [Thlaspi arvense]|uniref:Uncharacterized protein n=1 Tax=Thlaspi arvense TaxID=13288 RepID=A0AAU9S864_THLAR|nr:unnamed protein product [Thlaspi arvense]